jgi:hypothetical protein
VRKRENRGDIGGKGKMGRQRKKRFRRDREGLG